MLKPRFTALALLAAGLWGTSCGFRVQPLPPGDQPPVPPSMARIVAYSWSPVTRSADRLVYAIKVDRRNYDVRQVAAQLRARPPGQRVIRLWKWADPDLTRHPADRCRQPDGRPTEYWYPQPSAGIELVRARWRNFLAELHRHGAPLEEVILDFERGYFVSWLVEGDKAGHLAAIQSDPRFRGIEGRDGVKMTDLSGIADKHGQEDRIAWNAAMHKVADAALEAAIYEPLRERYPNARCSNYHSGRMGRDVAIPNPAGGRAWSDSGGFGTHDGTSAYGHLREVTEMPLRDGKPLGRSPYAALLYSMKRVEAAEDSSPKPLKVWIAPRDMTIPRGSRLTGTPYHNELIRHLVVRRFGLILWNGEPGGDADDQSLPLNAILDECARRIGETGPSLPHSTPWATGVIQSTTYHGDLAVHRFTLEDPRSGLRYRINGVDHVRHLGPGEVGLWVTHARGDDFHVVD